jgi:hypothetical protein
MPDMKISHFIVILHHGQLFTANLVRAVPVGMEDDTPLRVSLMAMLGTMVMGQVCPLENMGQIWSFWENHAAPSGFSLGIIEVAGREIPAPPGELPPGIGAEDDTKAALLPQATHPEPGHG